MPPKVGRSQTVALVDIQYSNYGLAKYQEPYRNRLWLHVDPDGDCWGWTGVVDRKGYGRAVARPKQKGSRQSELVHRMVWELLVGEIPEGFEVDHRCYNRSCVNPDHLEPVPPEVNRRRIRWTVNGTKIRCPQGHPYDVTYSDGRRGCRRCNAASARRRYVKKPSLVRESVA